VADFATEFKSFNDTLGKSLKGVLNMIDQWSFKSLVDGLKSEDYEAVATCIDQLVKENKPIAIPPLYFVANAHPNTHVRAKAAQALKQFGRDKEIEETTKGKSYEEGTKALIDLYGNYKR
jgi:hypothetical protein